MTNIMQAGMVNNMSARPRIVVVQVVGFSSGGTKLERFLPKNQHTYPKEIIKF